MESRRSTSISIKEKHEKSVLTSDLVEANMMQQNRYKLGGNQGKDGKSHINPCKSGSKYRISHLFK